MYVGYSAALFVTQATHLSLGVGFIAAYKPYTGSEVWVKPFDCQSNLFGELNVWHCHRIPAGSAALRQVACGRAHMVALTTDGKGMLYLYNNYTISCACTFTTRVLQFQCTQPDRIPLDSAEMLHNRKWSSMFSAVCLALQRE